MWKRLTRLLRSHSRADTGTGGVSLSQGQKGSSGTGKLVTALASSEDALQRIDFEIASGRALVALAALNALIESEPNHAPALVSRSYANLALFRLEDAESDASRAIELGLEHPNAFGNRAGVQMSQWRIEEALSNLEVASELDAKSETIITSRAVVWLKLGEYDKAETVRDELRGISGSQGAYHSLGARIRRARGDLVATLEEVDRALRANPLDTDLRVLRVDALCMLRDFQAAKDEIEVLVKLDAKCPAAIAANAIAALHINDLQRAVDLSRQLLERDPADWSGYTVCRAALYGLLRHEEALQLSAKAREHPILMPEAGLDCINSLFALGRYDEAHIQLDDLLKKYNRYPQVRMCHADRCLLSGRAAEAYEITGELFRLYPHVSEVWFSHALNCLLTDRFDQALHCAEQNVQRPYDVRALWIRACANQSLGNSAEGIAQADEAWRLLLLGEPRGFDHYVRLYNLARGHAVLAACQTDPARRSAHQAEGLASLRHYAERYPFWAVAFAHDPLLSTLRELPDFPGLPYP